MIIDPRIYATLYSIAIPAYFAACFIGASTVSNDRAQKWCRVALTASSAVLALTMFAHFQDWLWS